MSGGTGDLGLAVALHFLGDRPDVPRVRAEAGAARLLVATRDTGAVEQIEDGVTGLAVPHESPVVVARRWEALFDEVIAERDYRRLT